MTEPMQPDFTVPGECNCHLTRLAHECSVHGHIAPQTTTLAIEQEAATAERKRLRADRDTVICADHAVAFEQGVTAERERLALIVEKNHGAKGHPRPFIDCNREVCVVGWSFADDPEPRP